MIRSALIALLALITVTACTPQDDQPQVQLYPAVLEYWRPISDPNVFMPQSNANVKLNYDLAQCRCSNFPINYPQHAGAQVAPDLGRMAETSASMVDTETGCKTTPEGVLLECMRARGWEPTSCSGRLNTPGGTSCALSVHDVSPYPGEYPYANPYNSAYDQVPSGPERRQRYP